MKKVLFVFLGLVLLSQTVKLCERHYAAASLKRTAPARPHQAHPGKHDGNGANEPAIMIA